MLSFQGGLDDANTNDKVAEMLARFTLRSPSTEHWHQNGKSLLGVNIGAVQLIDTIAHIAATKQQVVEAVGLADQCDLGHPRTCTTVRTTGHSEHNGVGTQAKLVKLVLNSIEELRQESLGLGHGQATGREGDAGLRGHPEARELADVEQSVGLEDGVDGGLVGVCNVGDDHMLVACEPEPAHLVVDHVLCDEPHAGLVRLLARVRHTAVLDVAGEVVEALLVLTPAEVVPVRGELEWPGGLQFEPDRSLQLPLELVHAHRVDRVL